ncbi:MAG TPA: PAS domain S-box protein [Saprospiraceae bacterium]|nr:PAS domain S-box protein [Saprospiraceae bacterium]
MVSLLLSKAYLELIRFSALTYRSNFVYGSFLNLLRQVNNAAVLTPELLEESKKNLITDKLFFTDSISIIQELDFLKSNVKDSINIQLATKLDIAVRSELSWLLKSNVPDSIIHHKAADHILALQHIDLLTKQGIERTNFLLEYRERQMNKTLGKVQSWMVLFVILALGILMYTTVIFFRQKSRTKSAEKELEMSEDRFRALVENNQDVIALLDEKFEPVYRSPSAMRYTGWTEEERKNMTTLSLIHPDDLSNVKELMQQVLISPAKAVHLTYRIKHKNGNYIWLEGIVTNMLHDPNLSGIVTNFRDITARKQAEEDLQKSIKEVLEYRFALDEAAIVAVTDQKGIIKHVNDNFCEISKYSQDELIGQDHRLINSGYHSKQFIRNLWVTIARGHIWKGELKNKAKDGTIYWVDTTIVPFLNEEGKPFKYLAIRSDITQRKQAEDRIINMNEELEAKVEERTLELTQSLVREKELNELKSRFVSMASHEFRTPLSAILSSISLIDSYQLVEQKDKRDRHSERIKSSVHNLVDILNDFLSLDKLEQGILEIRKETFNLIEFSADIIEEVNGLLKPEQRIIFFHQGEQEVVQDKRILRNVFLNLLSNAIKYSEEGKEIQFLIEVNDKFVSVNVKDEGIGIPDEEQKYLFGKFYRAKNTENIQGTGLGLNIVKKYVELLNGSITFISKHNKGTTFTIEFPRY